LTFKQNNASIPPLGADTQQPKSTPLSAMTNKNGPFKDHLTLSIGGDLRICHFNIEGISKSKCEVLSKIMNKERIDVIALQETHTVDDEDIRKRGFIQGYLLLGAIHHKQYGVATYVKEDIDTCQITFEDNQDDIHVLAARIGIVTVTNIYKPPNTQWKFPPIKIFTPNVICRRF
jgi:hypothetical protein